MQTDNVIHYSQYNGVVLTLNELYKQQMEELEKRFPNYWTLYCHDVDEWLATPENPWSLTKAKKK